MSVAIKAKNVAFGEYVTGTKFALSLSESMVAMLLQFDELGHTGPPTTARASERRRTPRVRQFLMTGRALLDRGLVGHANEPYPGWWITEEGRLVAELCRRAGL